MKKIIYFLLSLPISFIFIWILGATIGLPPNMFIIRPKVELFYNGISSIENGYSIKFSTKQKFLDIFPNKVRSNLVCPLDLDETFLPDSSTDFIGLDGDINQTKVEVYNPKTKKYNYQVDTSIAIKKDSNYIESITLNDVKDGLKNKKVVRCKAIIIPNWFGGRAFQTEAMSIPVEDILNATNEVNFSNKK